MLDRASDLDRYFGTSQGKENYNEILILEEQESICKFFENSIKGISKIYVTFSRCTGGQMG
jgi:hypothetical protein